MEGKSFTECNGNIGEAEKMVAISRGCRVVVAILLCLGVLGRSAAQPPDDKGSGFTPTLPQVPQAPALPEKGPKSVTSFIDSLSRNDAVFEVVLGQARILTTKEDIQVAGKEQPVIAVGNPQVIDIGEKLFGKRQIRITGKRIGVTDLVITTSAGQTFSFEVHVIYNLDLMRARLRELFPDATIKLAQLGNKLVVEGPARDTLQIRQILQTLRPFPQFPQPGFFS